MSVDPGEHGASACVGCGAELAADARFCPSCGTPAAAAGAASREVRKSVTVLFADLSGSTELGERLDPEVVRTLLGRHFASMRSIIERHGGTVEKFIGDAVMAVFGIPTIHEDDALRAVRAGLEILTSVERLNEDPASPAPIHVRIGVNSGEVVTSSAGVGETLVTGDTVNTAARLEQAAEPGTVLIGSLTADLVRDAVQVEPIPQLVLKGKSEPVTPQRVIGIVGETGHARRHEGRLIGRDGELIRLTTAWRSTRDTGSARLVSLIAPAGVGKSRLLRAFREQLDDEARVVTGRCLPYGDGITYWPVREALHALAGIDETDDREGALSKLRGLVPVESLDAVEALAGALGLDTGPARQETIFWAVRRVFEEAAVRQPLAVFIEDAHWAESAMLDLLEYTVEMATAPLLLVVTARPELLTERAEWGSMPSAESLRLEPLSTSNAEEMLLGLAGGEALPQAVRARIIEASDGNPLFLEEMLAMLRERGVLREQQGRWELAAGSDGDVKIPPTVRALLAARLDMLPTEERRVLDHGAVIGRSFEAEAISAIGSDTVQADLGRRLFALVRKELLRADRSQISAGDAYRFRHVLIRDAAYDALPRAERAALHERFADWLEKAAGDRLAEFEEVVGYHLERAVAERRRLGSVDPAVDMLSQRAAERLRAAGRRARLRYDHAAVINLLGRATTLATIRDREVGHDYRYLRSAHSSLGDFAAASDTGRELDTLLESVEDRELRLYRDLMFTLDATMREEIGSWQRHREECERILAEAHSADLPGVQARAMIQLGTGLLQAGRPMDEFRLLEEAERIAERDPDPMTLVVVREYLANRLPILDMHINEIERHLNRLLKEADNDAELRAHAIAGLAYSAAAAERFAEARGMLEEVRVLAEERGLTIFRFFEFVGWAGAVEHMAGNEPAAESWTREGHVEMLRREYRWAVAYLAPMLAKLIALQPDRLDDARAAEVADLVASVRENVAEAHELEIAVGHQALALVHSWRGEHDEAVRLAADAAGVAARMGGPDDTADAYLTLATAERAAGHADPAKAAALRAREAATRKGLVPLIAMADAMIDPP